MKSVCICLLFLGFASGAMAEEKYLTCTYQGMVTMHEAGFWLQSKKDNGWYQIDGVNVVKSYRPTTGEVCVYE